MQFNYQGVNLQIVQGNIAGQNGIDAVVNAANAGLRKGAGVAGAIHQAAGPELEREAVKMAPIKTGQAVITEAYQLPNKKVIHCLGPVYGIDEPAGQLLADCYRNALKLAEQHQLTSIAFPAISTGVFAYPVEAAARVALTTIIETIPILRNIKTIKMVLFDLQAFNIHLSVLKGLLE